MTHREHTANPSKPKAGTAAKLSNLSRATGTGAPPRRAALVAIIAALALASMAFASSASAASATCCTITDVSYNTAHLEGKATSENPFRNAQFEYSTSEAGPWSNGPSESLGADPVTDKAVQGTLTVPKGATKYFVRLSITSGLFGTEATSPEPYPDFTTLAVEQPTIPGTVEATDIFSLQAKATGKIKRPANADPAFDVNCHFEYISDAQFQENLTNIGPEAGFEGATPAPCIENPITKDTVDPQSEEVVNADLPGLSPSTTYHLRLAAENAAPGVVTKEAANFTTAPKVAAPTVIAVGDASGLKFNSATLTGKILRPAGADPALNVNCHFEYVTDAAFQPLSEQQKLTLTGATAGTFTLSFAGETTASIAFDASAGDVQSALESLSAIGSGNVSVSGAYTIDFTGALADKDVEQIFADPSALEEAGVASAETTTPTEGHAGGFENPKTADCEQNTIKTDGETTVSAKAATVATTKYHYRLVAENEGGTDTMDAANTFTTLEAELPTVTIDPVEGGTFTTAHVSGTLLVDDPGHDPLTDFIPAFFEFSTDDINWVSANEGGAGLKNCTHTGCDLELDITGLQPSTTYFFRIGATYGGGGSRDQAIADGEMGFSAEPNPAITTEALQAPPTAENLAVTDLTATSAHFSATVNPNAPPGPLSPAAKKAYATKWHFECTPECLDANENAIGGTVQGEEGAQTVSGDVKRLDPKTPYEVRLIVSSEGGGYSEEETFLTSKSPPSVKQTPGAPDGEGGYTLQGVVNPHNETITGCKFEWGPDANKFAFSQDCSPLPDGVDERQRVKFEAGAGQFRLSFGGQTTADIPFDAEASVVQHALEALSSIGPSGVSAVTRTIESGSFNPFQVYDVTFSGPLGNQNLPPLEAENGTVPIGSLSVSTITNGGANIPITVEAHLTGLNADVTYHSLLVVTYGAGLEADSGEPVEFKATLAPKQPCPANEQQRTENNSLALPECRAYEMVTPPGKEGFGARLEAYDGGVRVAFGSGATNIAKSGQASAGKLNQYVAERTEAGWETIPNLNGSSGSFRDAPGYVESPFNSTNIVTYSQDLTSSIWILYRQGDPGNGATLIQRRNPDGTFAFLGSTANPWTVFLSHLLGIAASDDLSHLVAWKSIWGPGVYEFLGTGTDQPRRVDVDNSGAPISTCATVFGSAEARSVSSDGNTIIFKAFGGCGPANPPAGEIWARVNATTSFDVSASHCNRTVADPGGVCNGPAEPGGCVEKFGVNGLESPGCRNANFAAATPDGSRVFFTTTQQLVDGDIDQTNDIYACDLPSGNPVPSAEKANHCSAFRQVSGVETGANVESVNATSDDGATVLFTAKGVLADNEDALKEKAVAGDHNLYLWRADASQPDGETAFLGRLDSNDLRREAGTNAQEIAQATPDGRYLVFTTASQLVDTDTDTARDVYRYDIEAKELTRVSTNVVGVAGNGGFDALTPAERKPLPGTVSGKVVQPAISDDGTKIVFTTTEGLSAADGNAEPDVYLWTPAGVSLISTGSSGFAPRDSDGFAGDPRVAIDPSGEDIYFESAQALTPADPDSSNDVYDARIGGGFSFATPPVCTGEGCQPPPNPPSPNPLSPANQPNGDRNFKAPKPCPKGKVRKMNGKCVKKHKKHHKKNGKGKKAGHKQGGGK